MSTLKQNDSVDGRLEQWLPVVYCTGYFIEVQLVSFWCSVP